MQNASSRVNIGLDYFDMKVKCKQIINVNVNHASRSHCKQFLCNTKQTQSQYCYTANKMKKVNMRCSCIHWLFNIPGCRGHREAQLSSRNRWMDCEYFQSHQIPFQVPQLGQFSSQTTPIPQTPILVPPSSFIAHPPHKHTHPSFPCHCPLVGQLLWLKAIPNKNSAHAASGGREQDNPNWQSTDCWPASPVAPWTMEYWLNLTFSLIVSNTSTSFKFYALHSQQLCGQQSNKGSHTSPIAQFF